MSTVDICMNTICQQRHRQMLFTIPPARYTPPSPYVQFPQFTQKQFDMRRKAEILSYNATKTNTKTNNFTKKQKWVQLVSGTQQVTSYTTIIHRNSAPYTYTDACGNLIYNKFDQLFDIVKSTYDCSLSNDLIPTPTSASGIPGPIEYLIRDLKVPIYNYATNINNYSILQSENNDPWNIYTLDDLSFSTANSNLYGRLVIRQPIDQYAYTFMIQTPISLFVSGSSTSSGRTAITNLSLNIQSVSLQVYYNKTAIALQMQPVFTLNGIPLSLSANTAGNKYTANCTNNSAFLNYSITGTTPNYMYQDYVGMLSISNLYLYTEPGYIYDFYLTFSMQAPFLTTAAYIAQFETTTTYGVVCNTSSTLAQTVGVSNSSTNSKIPYTKNSMSGI
jgi:hypothetical protein